MRELVAKDYFGTLKLLAEIGYLGVETAGFKSVKPKEVRRVLDDLGMLCSSMHTPVPARENVNQLIDQASELNTDMLIAGLGPDDFKDAEGLSRSIDRLRAATALVHEQGMTFGYHNHDWEFAQVGGQVVYPALLSAVPEMFSELDIYWAQLGSGDTVKVIQDHADRIRMLHVKDGMLRTEKELRWTMTAVGGGKVPVKEAVKSANSDVLQWVVVELDNCATDIVQAVRESYKYITGEGLARGAHRS